MSERISGVEGTKLDDDFHRWGGEKTLDLLSGWYYHNLNIAAWKRRRICSTSWSMTCRSKQKSTFRWWQHEICFSVVFVTFTDRITFSPILRSEQRWQPSRWFFFSNLTSFLFTFTKKKHLIDLSTQHSPFKIVSINSVSPWVVMTRSKLIRGESKI